jgi:YHS domain-containing protein
MDAPAARPVPGLQPKLHAAGRKEALGMAQDPVGRISLEDGSPSTSTDAGQVRAFCCPSRKTTFDREPGRYRTLAQGQVRQGVRR